MAETRSGRYSHVVKALFSSAWALQPEVLAAICEFVELRASGESFEPDELQARIGQGPPRRDMQMAGSVAILPVHGVITPRADLFTNMSGGTSVQRLRSTFLDAIEDKAVSAVALDISSPGGMTDMIPEFAADIRAARGKKPIVAVANTKAGSAAYWLGAQADEFVASPSSMVGSIGVFAAHEDLSAAAEQAGVKTTLISAGKYKTEGNPWGPLSEEATAAIQARVDEMYGMFTADVARGRRAPVATVRDGYGEGRMLTAKQALAAGMVDRIGTLDSVVGELARGRVRVEPDALPEDDAAAVTGSTGKVHVQITADTTKFEQALSSATFVQEAHALHDSASRLVDRLTSLAEVKSGSLTVAKRESLAACPGALRDAAAQIEQVLAATDPNKHRDELASLYARAVATGNL